MSEPTTTPVMFEMLCLAFGIGLTLIALITLAANFRRTIN
jgi:hypothetical protein